MSPPPENSLESRMGKVEPVRAPVQGPAPVTAARSNSWLLPALGVALLGGVIVGVASLSTRRNASGDGVHEASPLDRLSSAHVPAVIGSTPAGASIEIAGQVIGVTPWAGDNRWGATEVRLTMPGYRPWKGTLKTEETVINATLLRSTP